MLTTFSVTFASLLIKSLPSKLKVDKNVKNAEFKHLRKCIRGKRRGKEGSLKMSRGQESTGPVGGEEPHPILTELPAGACPSKGQGHICPGEARTCPQGTQANKARCTWAYFSRTCVDQGLESQPLLVGMLVDLCTYFSFLIMKI